MITRMVRIKLNYKEVLMEDSKCFLHVWPNEATEMIKKTCNKGDKINFSFRTIFNKNRGECITSIFYKDRFLANLNDENEKKFSQRSEKSNAEVTLISCNFDKQTTRYVLALEIGPFVKVKEKRKNEDRATIIENMRNKKIWYEKYWSSQWN